MFVRVVYVCMLLRQKKTRTWLSTNTEPETDFATVLNILSPKSLLTLFVLFSGHFDDVCGR